jgi:hypothetical protein
MVGVPGIFLVFWDERYRGMLTWTAKGWIMDGGIEQGLTNALGEWIVIYFQ